MSKEELEETKKLIRATLISSPQNNLTVHELCYQYRKIVEEEIPYRKFNFRSAYEFLRAIPESVQLLDPRNSNSYVRPVTNEKTEHLRKLVQEQNPSSKNDSRRCGENYIRRPNVHRKRFQPPRPILNNDFKKDVYKLLRDFPTGMYWEEFDTHVQIILASHYLSEYDSEEVLKNIAEFAFCHDGRVFLNKTRNSNNATRSDSVFETKSCCSSSRNEEFDGYPFISNRLFDNLRALLEDEKYASGIWLSQLTKNYESKFGYPLRPKEHGFTDAMDLVANLKTIFHLKQCREDYLLLDARFSPNKKERKKEDNIEDIVFHERLNYITKDMSDLGRSSCEITPVDVTDNSFPPEVCDGDVYLETDPKLADSEEGQTFGIHFGEVYSPAKFYITHINRVNLLESMMKDLNEFYNAHEQKYQIPVSLVSRSLLCACTYSGNSEWHRVRVLSIHLTFVKIFYVDYGTEENVNIEKLRYLHKDFVEFPAFCIQAKLFNIKSKDGSSYNPTVCRKFFTLFANKNLEAEVVHVAPNYLEIMLHFQEGDCRMAAHEVLLEQNLVSAAQNTTPPASLPEPPTPGIPFCQPQHLSQLPYSYPNQMYRAQVQTDVNIPCSLYGCLCSSPYSFYSDPSIVGPTFAETIYPTCAICHMEQCLNTLNHQYLNTASFAYSFRPPPGIPPMWQDSNIPLNYPSPLEFPYDSTGRLSYTSLANSLPAENSSVPEVSHENTVSRYETCQSRIVKESNKSYLRASSPSTESVSSELAEMNNDVMKEMLEEFVRKQMKKIVRRSNTNTRSLEKSEEPTSNVRVLKEAMKDELKEYLQSNEYEEDSVEFPINAEREIPLLTPSQIKDYAGELSPKMNSKIGTESNKLEISSDTLSTLTMRETSKDDEKLDTKNILNDLQTPIKNGKIVQDELNFENTTSVNLEAHPTHMPTIDKQADCGTFNSIRFFVRQQMKKN